MVTSLVEEKGADPTLRCATGGTAAEMASSGGNARLQRYLKAQQARQVSEKEKRKKAAAAATMAARMREAEKGMAALLLEL